MTFYDFIDYLTYLSPAALLLGITFGLWHFRSLDDAHKTVTLYLFISLLTDLLMRMFAYLFDNNLVFILIFSLVELALFAFLYFRLLLERRYPTLLILVLIGILFIGWELLNLKFFSIPQFQSYSKVVDTLLIVLLSITFFFECLRKEKDARWNFFRLNAVILAFFSLNLIFFLPINFLINEKSNLKFYFWLGNLVATIAFYLFLTREIWKNGTTRKRLRSG